MKKVLLLTLSVIMLVALPLSFVTIGGKFDSLLKVSDGTVSMWARKILMTATALALIVAGALTFAVPIIAIAFISTGVVLLLYAWWPKRDKE